MALPQATTGMAKRRTRVRPRYTNQISHNINSQPLAIVMELRIMRSCRTEIGNRHLLKLSRSTSQDTMIYGPGYWYVGRVSSALTKILSDDSVNTSSSSHFWALLQSLGSHFKAIRQIRGSVAEGSMMLQTTSRSIPTQSSCSHSCSS